MDGVRLADTDGYFSDVYMPVRLSSSGPIKHGKMNGVRNTLHRQGGRDQPCGILSLDKSGM
jgi:hypothetical protein